MRGVVSILVVIALLFNSGCAIYEKETTNRGGYLDAVLDDHWMKADSKGMRALRAFAIQVSLARIASVAAKNESDRQLLAIRIGALTKRFVPIYLCAFNTNPLGVEGAKNDPCFYYDSAMVDYSTGLFDLAMIALPIEDAKKLITQMAGTAINPINVIELLTNLLQIGKDALRYGRIVGALYRDTVELEVQVWLSTPAIDRRLPPYQVTPTDVAALADVYARGNDDMTAWLAEIAALRARGLEPVPQPKFFGELAGLLNYLCDLITKDPDANSPKTCKASLPETLPPPAEVLGPAPRLRIGDSKVPSLAIGGKSGSGSQQPGGEKAAPKPTPPALMTGAIADIEKNMTVADGRKLQRMLCVPQSDGFDAATREQLKNFNRAILFPTDNNAGDQIATDAGLQKLRDAQRRFPICTDAKFRNGFEVGLVSRLEFAGTPLRGMLNNALSNKTLNPDGNSHLAPLSAPKAPAAIDDAARTAIGSLATKFGLTGTDVTREFYVKLNPER
jgi:hypothetical protein